MILQVEPVRKPVLFSEGELLEKGGWLAPIARRNFHTTAPVHNQ
jgi:hypothetical protein